MRVVWTSGVVVLTGAIVLAGAVASRPAKVDDFTLQPVVAPFALSEHRGQFVALHFLLKTECPLCLKHTRDYATRADELPNVVQVFIKPDSEEEIRRWTRRLDQGGACPHVIYRDPEAALARRFGIPNGYKFHGQTVHFPALVLIGPEGNEVFRYVGRSNADRFAFDKLKAKVAELKRR